MKFFNGLRHHFWQVLVYLFGHVGLEGDVCIRVESERLRRINKGKVLDSSTVVLDGATLRNGVPWKLKIREVTER